MKNGIAILIFLGLVIVAFFYMSPVTPAVEEAVKDTESQVETSSETSLDKQVDAALTKMESGELAPMQAILTIRNIADENPGHVKSNFTLGVLSMRTAQYEKAVGRFETVLKAQPNDGQVWKFLAEAQLNLGDTAQANESFTQALENVDEATAKAYQDELPLLKSIN